MFHTRLYRSLSRSSKVGVLTDDLHSSFTVFPKTRQYLRRLRIKGAFLPLLLLSILLGFGLGSLLRLREDPYTVKELMYLRFPADFLCNMLHVLTLPLIMSSIVTGPTQLHIKVLRSLALKVGVFYLCMTVLAAILGTVFANVAYHCKSGDPSMVYTDPLKGLTATDLLFDIIRNMLPNNLVDMTFRKYATTLKEKEVPASSATHKNATNGTSVSANNTVYVPEIESVKGVNLLGVITISYIAGMLITRLGSMTLTLKVFFEAIYDVTKILISIVAWYIPFGVVFLLMEQTAVEREQVFRHWIYLVTVCSGLAVYGFLFLPAIYYCVSGQNPYVAMRGVLPALAVAFATSSNVLALPFTMQNLEKNNRLNPYVVMMVAPIGAALNLPSKALFGPIAAAFVGCMSNVFTHLHSGSLLIFCVMAVVLALVTEGVPREDVVTASLLLTTVDIPRDRIGHILPPDWLLGRFRAVISVLNDAYGAGIVHHLSKHPLLPFQMSQEPADTVPLEESPGSSLHSSVVPAAAAPVPPVPVAMTVIREETDVTAGEQEACAVENNGKDIIVQDASNRPTTTQDSLTERKMTGSATVVVVADHDADTAAAAAANDGDGDDDDKKDAQ